MKNPILVPELPELRELLEKQDFDAIRAFCENTHPASVAEFLSALEPAEIWQILRRLDLDLRAEVFSHLDLEQQADLAPGARPKAMAQLIEEMAPDDRADLIQEIDEEVRDAILPLVAQAERRDIIKLASYPENTAGAEMTTDFVALPEGLAVREALERLRHEAEDEETIYDIYVVDEQRRLRGYISLSRLVMSPSDGTLGGIMERDLIYARVDEDREDVAQKINKYDLLSIPVIDGAEAIVGIVTVDDVIDIIEAEVDEDIYHLGAAGAPTDYLKTSSLNMARRRVTWLLVLVLVGFVSGLVMQQYHDVLAAFQVLAFFLPLLMGAGGNAGSQATMVVVRGLATGELTTADWSRVVRKELAVAMLVGVSLAVLAALRAVIMHHDHGPAMTLDLAATVALAMFGCVVLANLLGSVTPLLLKRLGVDPALMSTPLIATIMDVATIVIYFQAARWILPMAAAS